jgi:hypothetical protein
MYRRALVALDGSEVAETIVPFIFEIAGPLDGGRGGEAGERGAGFRRGRAHGGLSVSRPPSHPSSE